VCGGCFTILIQLGSSDLGFFYRLSRVNFSGRDELSPRMSLFLQEHLNVILEDLDASSLGRTLLGFKRDPKHDRTTS
jgi:hypothetical protein